MTVTQRRASQVQPVTMSNIMDDGQKGHFVKRLVMESGTSLLGAAMMLGLIFGGCCSNVS